MHFSWRALILAPLLAPVVLCVIAAPLLNGDGPVVLPFLILLIPACVISYGTTVFLFLPALYLLSLWRPLTALIACLLGVALGAAMIAPITVLMWKSSGPDSGPPTEPLREFFQSWATDPLMLVFPAAGLVTAALYWWLGTRRREVVPAKAGTHNHRP